MLEAIEGGVMKEEAREKIAGDHWEYTRGIIVKLDPSLPERYLSLMEYLYIEAAIHFFKHGKEES